ncbi:MAG: Gfo/Idh/MocA family oxidoreductase [Hymenobacter sp.]
MVIEKPIALHKTDAETNCAHGPANRPAGVWGDAEPLLAARRLAQAGVMTRAGWARCFWCSSTASGTAMPATTSPGGWKGTQALDGGTLFTQFSHFVDLLYWVFGDITNISARFRDFTHAGITDFEDSGLVTFDLVRGGSGTLSYSTAVWDRNLESSLTVVAERGSPAKSAASTWTKWSTATCEDYDAYPLPPTNPANDYGPYQGSAANHVQVIENVVDTVQQRSSATTNALEGLKVVEIIERIYALRQPVPAVPLPPR